MRGDAESAAGRDAARSSCSSAWARAAGVVAWLVLSHNGHPVRPWLVLALCVTGGVVAAVLRVLTVQVPAPAKVPTRLPRRALHRPRAWRRRTAGAVLDSGIESADRFDLRVRPS